MFSHYERLPGIRVNKLPRNRALKSVTAVTHYGRGGVLIRTERGTIYAGGVTNAFGRVSMRNLPDVAALFRVGAITEEAFNEWRDEARVREDRNKKTDAAYALQRSAEAMGMKLTAHQARKISEVINVRR